VENFLLDSQAIYEALKVMEGKEKLERKDYRSYEDIELLKKKIIGGRNFLRELKVRINKEATFYISTDQLPYLVSLNSNSHSRT
jgi:hypothetical protein